MFKTLKNKIEARRQNRMNEAIQEFLLENPMELTQFQINTIAIETAQHIDASDIAQNFEIDSRDIAYHFETCDIAEHFETYEIAEHISHSDIAEHINIDADAVSYHIDMDALATLCQEKLEAPNINIDDLNIDIDGIVEQVMSQIDLADLVNQVCEEIANRIEG